jgi:hypothetical protein
LDQCVYVNRSILKRRSIHTSYIYWIHNTARVSRIDYMRTQEELSWYTKQCPALPVVWILNQTSGSCAMPF